MTQPAIPTPTTINATEIAQKLRRAADYLESGDFHGLFAARLELNIPVYQLTAFCEAANDYGTAPDFFAIAAWVAAHPH